MLSPPDSQASPHLPPRPCTGGGKRGPQDSGMVPSCFPASPRVLPPSPLSSELGRFLLSSVQRPPSLILPCPLSGGLEDPGTPPAPLLWRKDAGSAGNGWLVCRAKEVPANLLPHPFPDPGWGHPAPPTLMPAAPWHHCPPYCLLCIPIIFIPSGLSGSPGWFVASGVQAEGHLDPIRGRLQSPQLDAYP